MKNLKQKVILCLFIPRQNRFCETCATLKLRRSCECMSELEVQQQKKSRYGTETDEVQCITPPEVFRCLVALLETLWGGRTGHVRCHVQRLCIALRSSHTAAGTDRPAQVRGAPVVQYHSAVLIPTADCPCKSVTFRPLATFAAVVTHCLKPRPPATAHITWNRPSRLAKTPVSGCL